MLYGLNEWNKLDGVWNRFFTSSGTTSCTLRRYDGEHEVAFVQPSEIDGNFGVAHRRYEPCTSPYGDPFDGDLIEADVWISNVPPTGALAPLETGIGAREVIVHEFGHVLGANHENGDWSVMCSADKTCGKIAGHDRYGNTFNRTESVLADDVAMALRWHGNTFAGKREVTVSAMMQDTWSGGAMLTYPNKIVQKRCPGWTFSFKFSHLLRGKNGISPGDEVKMRVVLSPDTNISVTDYFAGEVWLGGQSGQWFTNEWTATVPYGIPTGVYWIGLIVDPNDDELDEEDEGNNAVWLNKQINFPAFYC